MWNLFIELNKWKDHDCKAAGARHLFMKTLTARIHTEHTHMYMTSAKYSHSQIQLATDNNRRIVSFQCCMPQRDDRQRQIDWASARHMTARALCVLQCSAQVLIAICQLSALCVECGCIIFRAIEGASWSHSSSLPSDLHVMRSPFPSPPPSPSGGAVNHLKCSKGRCRGGDTPVMHAIFDTAQGRPPPAFAVAAKRQTAPFLLL